MLNGWKTTVSIIVCAGFLTPFTGQAQTSNPPAERVAAQQQQAHNYITPQLSPEQRAAQLRAAQESRAEQQRAQQAYAEQNPGAKYGATPMSPVQLLSLIHI